MARRSAWAVGTVGRAVSSIRFDRETRRTSFSFKLQLTSVFLFFSSSSSSSFHLALLCSHPPHSYVYTIPTTHSPTANLSSNALIPALLKAKATSIGRFIPDEMKEEAMFARVKGMMLKDWREEGRKVVKEKGEGEER